jgi:hypothetical protein
MGYQPIVGLTYIQMNILLAENSKSDPELHDEPKKTGSTIIDIQCCKR